MIITFLISSSTGRFRHCRNQRSGITGYVVELTEEERLIKHILKWYEYRGKYSRPLAKYQDRMTVKFGLQLIQIIDLDEKEQILTINVWVDHVSKGYIMVYNVCDKSFIRFMHFV